MCPLIGGSWAFVSDDAAYRMVCTGPVAARTRKPPAATAGGFRGGACASEVDAEVLRDAAQAGGVTLADGAELPLRAVAVQLTEDHCGLG